MSSLALGLSLVSRRKSNLKNPVEIFGSACVVWFDPIDPLNPTYESGTLLTGMDNKGSDATIDFVAQGTGAALPSLTATGGINGRQSFVCNGAQEVRSQNIDVTSFPNGGEIFVVAKAASDNSDKPLYNLGPNTQETYYSRSGNLFYTDGLTTARKAQLEVEDNLGMVMNEAHLCREVSLANDHRVYLDNKLIMETGTNTVGYKASYSIWFRGQVAYHDGPVGDIVMVNRETTEAEREEFHAWINDRWNLGISIGIWNPAEILGKNLEYWIDMQNAAATFNTEPRVAEIPASDAHHADYKLEQATEADQMDLMVTEGKMNGRRALVCEGVAENKFMTQGTRHYLRYGSGGIGPFVQLSVLQNFVEPQASSNDGGLTDWTTHNNVEYWRDTDGNCYVNLGTSARKTVGKIAHNLARVHLQEILSDTNNFHVMVDGVEVFQTATNTKGFPNATFGRFYSNTSFFKGWHGDIVAASVEPTNAQREKLNLFFNSRWNVGLPEKITAPDSLPISGNLKVVSNGNAIIKLDMGGTLDSSIATSLFMGALNCDGLGYDPTDQTLWATNELGVSGTSQPDEPRIFNFTEAGVLINSFSTDQFSSSATLEIENVGVMPEDGSLLILSDETGQGDLWHCERDGTLRQRFDLTDITNKTHWDTGAAGNYVKSPQGFCINNDLKQIVIVDNSGVGFTFFFAYTISTAGVMTLEFIKRIPTGFIAGDISYSNAHKLYWVAEYNPNQKLHLVDGLMNQYDSIDETDYGATEGHAPTGIAVIP